MPHDPQFAVVQTLKRLAGGQGQAWIAGQGAGETQLMMGGCFLEDTGDFPFQPLRVKVEHAVSEAVDRRGIAVVEFPRLQQEHLPRHAVMAHAPAVELLHALFGHAYQVAVVPMGVIRMAFEMRAQGLDAGVGVLGQVDPIVRRHTTPRRKVKGY